MYIIVLYIYFCFYQSTLQSYKLYTKCSRYCLLNDRAQSRVSFPGVILCSQFLMSEDFGHHQSCRRRRWSVFTSIYQVRLSKPYRNLKMAIPYWTGHCDGYWPRYLLPSMFPTTQQTGIAIEPITILFQSSQSLLLLQYGFYSKVMIIQ